MYLLGCHCLVALYMLTDRFRVWKTARTRSALLRNSLGIIQYTASPDGILLNETLQIPIPPTGTIVTAKKWLMTKSRNHETAMAHVSQLKTHITMVCTT